MFCSDAAGPPTAARNVAPSKARAEPSVTASHQDGPSDRVTDSSHGRE